MWNHAQKPDLENSRELNIFSTCRRVSTFQYFFRRMLSFLRRGERLTISRSMNWMGSWAFFHSCPPGYFCEYSWISMKFKCIYIPWGCIQSIKPVLFTKLSFTNYPGSTEHIKATSINPYESTTQYVNIFAPSSSPKFNFFHNRICKWNWIWISMFTEKHIAPKPTWIKWINGLVWRGGKQEVWSKKKVYAGNSGRCLSNLHDHWGGVRNKAQPGLQDSVTIVNIVYKVVFSILVKWFLDLVCIVGLTQAQLD